MNMQIIGLRVASVVFGLVALGHLLRVFLRFNIYIDGFYIHRWMSAVAVVVAALLSVWLWMLAKPAAGPAPRPDRP
jgi:hypothetical protein